MANPPLDAGRIVDVMYDFARRKSKGGSAIRLPRPFDGSFPIDNTGIDSMDTADLAVHLETSLGIELDFAAFLRSKTLADVVVLVSRALASQSARLARAESNG